MTTNFAVTSHDRRVFLPADLDKLNDFWLHATIDGEHVTGTRSRKRNAVLFEVPHTLPAGDYPIRVFADEIPLAQGTVRVQ